MSLLSNEYIFYNGEYITSEEFKKILKNKNLYSSLDEYPKSLTPKQELLNKTAVVVNYIQPFETFDIRNTVYGRLIDFSYNTPLVQIGIEALGKSLLKNVKSSLSKKYIPKINLKNVLNKNEDVIDWKTKGLLIDPWSITKITDGEYLTRFLNTITNFYPQSFSPFSSYSPKGSYYHSSDDLIEQSGSAQLDVLFSNLNNNIYKPINEKYLVDRSIFPQLNYFDNQLIHDALLPYHGGSIEEANKQQSFSVKEMLNVSSEYGQPSSFYPFYFGTVNKEKTFSDFDFNHKSQNEWVVDRSNDINKKLIWGRDGITDGVNKRINNLRGIDDLRGIDNDILTDNYKKFNIKGGLLEHTRNLLIANSGNKIDITRKVFKGGVSNKISGFQGSALWRAPSESPLPDYSQPTDAGKIGLRQHTVLDPYDNFAKSIRFDGNKLYGGNENSVIHNSVIPRIHPTKDDSGTIDARNLMFSIENLSTKIIVDEQRKFGMLDDEEGTLIPLSEVGPLNGRLMWFAPYAIEFNEQTNNTFETTVMMGRGEPIYNYQHSERGATIRFKLLIDHPPQVKGMNNHKDIAEFFAFGLSGGDSTIDVSDIPETTPIPETDSPTDEEIIPPDDILIVFPNDYPKPGDEEKIIDIMYKKNSYEVSSDIMSSDGTSFGLNKNIFCFDESHVISVTGSTGSYKKINPVIDFSQYDCDNRNVKLNSSLLELFNDENNRNKYYIEIISSATKLYDGPLPEYKYNMELSKRRSNAVKYFLKKRLEALFKKSISNLGIEIKTRAIGSTTGKEEYKERGTISDKGAKEERSSRIIFIRNSKPNETTDIELSPEEIENKQESIDENIKIEAEKRRRKDQVIKHIYELHKKNDPSLINTFDSPIRNKFLPTFYSQTPEDFHRRLTFLQQCTRQGSAIARKEEMGDEGIFRVKNSVFGRQPVNVLRIGDFFNTKFIIETLTIDYDDTIWDLNPEGFGMQPMFAEITLNIKMIGGQSLEGPISALQNAISYNHYANSTFSNKGVYHKATQVAKQEYDKNVEEDDE